MEQEKIFILLTDKKFNDESIISIGTKVKEMFIDVDGMINVETFEDNEIRNFWVNKNEIKECKN